MILVLTNSFEDLFRKKTLNTRQTILKHLFTSHQTNLKIAHIRQYKHLLLLRPTTTSGKCPYLIFTFLECFMTLCLYFKSYLTFQNHRNHYFQIRILVKCFWNVSVFEKVTQRYFNNIKYLLEKMALN